MIAQLPRIVNMSRDLEFRVLNTRRIFGDPKVVQGVHFSRTIEIENYEDNES